MKEVAKNVFHIPLMPRNSINCYLIEDILIDAGIKNSYTKILNAVKNKAVNIHALTHAHADHQGSSKVVCDTLQIPLWCSSLEKPQVESGNATKEYPYQNHLVTKFQRKYWAGDGCAVAKVIKEGDDVAGFKVIGTPGHSSGHISFYRERDGVLIVGDVLVNMNLLTTFAGLHQPPGLFTWPIADFIISNLVQWNIKKRLSIVSYTSYSFNSAFIREYNYIKTNYNYTLSQKFGVGTSLYTKKSSHTFSFIAGIKYDAFKETLENPAFEHISASVSSVSPDVGLLYNLKMGKKKYFFSYRMYIPLYPYPFKTLDIYAIDGNEANFTLEFGFGIRLK